MATVTLRGLRRHFQGVESPALVGLDLEVRDGELLVLVGPSGCGKSTALRLVAGLDTADAGSIRIDDRDVANVPPQDRDVAMVFQGYALYPHKTARENIAFPLSMRGVSKSEQATRVNEAAALLGLEKLLDRRPGELSGGERQRVAMGRAIVRKPKVFLFDEPLSNLDAALRTELRVEIAALVRRLGVTSLYVTHDQVEAMTMGDRIAVMKKGELQQIGAPREIYEDPVNTFVAGFLGTPPINWIDMERRDNALFGAGATWPLPQGIELPRAVKAGLRPEHLSLSGEGVSIEGSVVQVEPLGAETHVLVEAKGALLRMRVPGFDAPARGERVKVVAKADNVLWFDEASGLRVRGFRP